jgi:hypothetical protein
MRTVAMSDLYGSRADVAQAWPPLKDWLLQPVERVDPWRPVLGFACGLNLSFEGRRDHPQPPDDLPKTPLFNLSLLRDFDPYPGAAPLRTPTEHGIEWWYRPDSDWMSLTELEAWDVGHPVGFHFWGFGDEGARKFVSDVERTPMFQLAQRKRAIFARVFGVIDDPVGIVLRQFDRT